MAERSSVKAGLQELVKRTKDIEETVFIGEPLQWSLDSKGASEGILHHSPGAAEAIWQALKPGHEFAFTKDIECLEEEDLSLAPRWLRLYARESEGQAGIPIMEIGLSAGTEREGPIGSVTLSLGIGDEALSVEADRHFWYRGKEPVAINIRGEEFDDNQLLGSLAMWIAWCHDEAMREL